jgi:hypothetical protein
LCIALTSQVDIMEWLSQQMQNFILGVGMGM